MIAVVNYDATDPPIAPKTASGSLSRRFTLPIELSGVSVTINGVACGLRSVGQRRIEFVVPPAIASAVTGTIFRFTIHNNGVLMKRWITIVPTRPDIFAKDGYVGPGGRAKLFNVTNTVFTGEPFTVRTIKRRGNLLVPSVLRLYLTGVENVGTTVMTIRIRDQSVVARANPVLVEPGIYTVDFEMPVGLMGAGDQPIVVSVLVDSVTFNSRLDDTSTRLFIL